MSEPDSISRRKRSRHRSGAGSCGAAGAPPALPERRRRPPTCRIWRPRSDRQALGYHENAKTRGAKQIPDL